jgi:hypothetical protein
MHLFTTLSPSSVYVLCSNTHTENAMPHSRDQGSGHLYTQV